VNYHLHTLEAHGLVQVADTRQWGGLTERLLVATASSSIVSPTAMGAVAADPGRGGDRLSGSYLIALAARIVREVGNLLRRSRETGQRRSSSAGAPPLNGVVEAVREGTHPYTLLLLDEPAPGAAFLNACPMGGQVFMTISFHLFGDRAADAVQRNEPLWQAWMSMQYPPVDEPAQIG
jgi:hypothetical protein